MINQIKKEVLSKADKLLITKTLKGIPNLYSEITEEIKDRVWHELNTIINMGFSDYFLIVQDFLDLGRRCGHMPDERLAYLSEHHEEMTISELNEYINADQSMPGMTIGPGRGSAAGSIVAFALGITSIDPIKNGLLFERFLNPERVSMPDIDSDLSKSDFKYGVRDIVIDYVCKKYGAGGVCGITTPNTLAAKASIVNISRIHGARKGDKTMFYRLKDQMNGLVSDEPNAVLADADEAIREKFANNKDAEEILNMAEAVEGLNINFGRHACGNIIVGDGDVGAHAPLLKDEETGQWKIQIDAETSESLGFLKMDFLGLKNLNLITKTVRDILQHTGKSVDPLRIPEDPAVYKNIFAAGKTFSIFQFESEGMRKMLTKFEPESFMDIVLLVACYRPGPMQYLDGIIARKHGKPAEQNAVTRIASYYKPFSEIVSQTYMALVYQEQIMQTFRMVGFSLGKADNVRRAMGHKKMDILVAEKQNFVYGNKEEGIKGAIEVGIREKDALALFDEMIEFAKYSFNKSHAAAYAQVAYITAWLKNYFPTEFYAAALGFADFDKYGALISEASSFGVQVQAPDVNKSEVQFSGRDGKVWFGFSGIKGIGASVASNIRKGCEYKTLAEFVIQSPIKLATAKLLLEAGAFDCFCSSRRAMAEILPDMYVEKERITKAEILKKQCEAMLDDLNAGKELDRVKYGIKTKSLPTKEKLEAKIATAENTQQEAKDAIRQEIIPVKEFPDNRRERLDSERKLLGIYVTGNPLDSYEIPQNALKICNLEERNSGTVCGVITDVKRTVKKSTNEQIAFLTLEDKTGKINVCVFAEAYPKYEHLFQEGNVVIVTGRIAPDKRSAEDEHRLQIIARDITEAIEHRDGYLLILQEDLSTWAKVRNTVLRCIEENGHPLTLKFMITGKEIPTSYVVSPRIRKELSGLIRTI